MKKVYHLTEEGLNELSVELESLKSQRGVIAERIAEARDHGDLSENAEYDAARSEQGVVETRIAEIEEIMLNAEIIKNKDNSKVSIGSQVELQTDDGKKKKYSVVGPIEADPLAGRISDASPMGQAMLGKKKGESFSVQTPKGEITYTIASIN